jgi:hypothetical protein
MDQARAATSEPPSTGGERWYPGRVVGHATTRYWAIVEALAEGLAEYEARMRAQGGTRGKAATPIPAA